MLINVMKKYKKAYTLYELVIYMMLVGLVLYPMAPMLSYSVQQLKIEEDKYDPNFYNFVEDIKYDNIISKEITCNNNSGCSEDNTKITFTRIDNCVVSYTYDETNKEVIRTIDSKGKDCEEGLREYKLIKIDDFNISIGGFVDKDGIFRTTKTNSVFIQSEKYNYNMTYVLFNKNKEL